MKVLSLAHAGKKLEPVEVELVLAPGLPQIHFLGLPDQLIRESTHRIKSAIRRQGFEFPRAQQILVNIRPQHIKKSSRGVELAVAAAFLWETGQLPAPLAQNDYFIYGELGLGGEVYEPEDLREFSGSAGMTVLTGISDEAKNFARHCIESLKDLNSPLQRAPEFPQVRAERPQAGLDLKFSPEQARVLKILALGGHHALLAGPAGSGKSTLARSLISFFREPTSEEIHLKQRTWSPVVSPHHSVSAQTLVGGGVPPKAGEITRADGGLLIMDELLEYSAAAQEALREPLEQGFVEIARGFKHEVFPSRFQLVATTNLCPCGQWTPGAPTQCRFARHKCSSVQQKLSGPFLDRFEVLHFTERPDVNAMDQRSDQVSGRDILKELELVRLWQRQDAGAERWSDFMRKNLWPRDFSSRRRQQASLDVSETIADLDFSSEILPQHLEEALQLTHYPFEKLARGM